jgi:hypothetical protein
LHRFGPGRRRRPRRAGPALLTNPFPAVEGKRSVALLSLALIGCAPDSPPENRIDALGRPVAPLTPAEREAGGLTRAWMVGYWAYEGNCRSRLETALWADGNYTMGDGGGRWSLSGNRLTIVEQRPPGIQFMRVRLGDPGPSTIRKLGADLIEVRWEGGGLPSRFVRCGQ